MKNTIGGVLSKMMKTPSWKLKNMKQSTISFVKYCLFGLMFLCLIKGLILPYAQMMKYFVNISGVFLTSSIIYYIETPSAKDRAILLNMWKLYFPIIALMVVMIYSIETNTNKTKIDFLKTKLLYETKTNQIEASKTFAEYEKFVNSYVNSYKKKDMNSSKSSNQKLLKSKTDILLYANYAMIFTNITTLFMFLWGLSELSLFKQEEKKRRYIEKYKNISK